jgi:hypothetical protein
MYIYQIYLSIYQSIYLSIYLYVYAKTIGCGTFSCMMCYELSICCSIFKASYGLGLSCVFVCLQSFLQSGSVPLLVFVYFSWWWGLRSSNITCATCMILLDRRWVNVQSNMKTATKHDPLQSLIEHIERVCPIPIWAWIINCLMKTLVARPKSWTLDRTPEYVPLSEWQAPKQSPVIICRVLEVPSVYYRNEFEWWIFSCTSRDVDMQTFVQAYMRVCMVMCLYWWRARGIAVLDWIIWILQSLITSLDRFDRLL